MSSWLHGVSRFAPERILMKKVVAVLLGVIAALSLASCGDALSGGEAASTETIRPKNTMSIFADRDSDTTETAAVAETVETAAVSTDVETPAPVVDAPAPSVDAPAPAVDDPAPADEYSRTVYVTPTGKRYHFSHDCAGKNGRAVSIEEAQKRYTPCKKCAS